MKVTARASSSDERRARCASRSPRCAIAQDRRVDARRFDAASEPGDLALLAVTLGTADVEPRPRRLSTSASNPRFRRAPGSAAPPRCAVARRRRLPARVRRRRRARRDRATRALRSSGISTGGASGVDVEAVLRGGVLWCRRSDDGDAGARGASRAGRRLDAFRLFHSGAPERDDRRHGRRGAAPLRSRAGARRARVRGDRSGDARRARRARCRGDGGALVPIVRRAEAALEAIGVVPRCVLERDPRDRSATAARRRSRAPED